jgi:hypothetical protein
VSSCAETAQLTSSSPIRKALQFRRITWFLYGRANLYVPDHLTASASIPADVEETRMSLAWRNLSGVLASVNQTLRAPPKHCPIQQFATFQPSSYPQLPLLENYEGVLHCCHDRRGAVGGFGR